MRALAAALVFVLAVGTARAQPGNTEPIDPEEPPQPAYSTPPQSQYQAPLLPPDRDEDTALWLSLGGTLGSYALTFGGAAIGGGELAGVGLIGTFFAPTFGHWYGGKGFTRGLGIRVGALSIGLTALLAASSGCSTGWGHDVQETPDCGQGNNAAAVMGIIAAGLWIGGTVDDIVQAPKRVRRRNAARFAVAPLLQGDRAGLALVGAF